MLSKSIWFDPFRRWDRHLALLCREISRSLPLARWNFSERLLNQRLYKSCELKIHFKSCFELLYVCFLLWMISNYEHRLTHFQNHSIFIYMCMYTIKKYCRKRNCMHIVRISVSISSSILFTYVNIFRQRQKIIKLAYVPSIWTSLHTYISTILPTLAIIPKLWISLVASPKIKLHQLWM